MIDGIGDGLSPGARGAWIAFGPSYFRPEGGDCLTYRVETLQLDVWCEKRGRKWPAKQIVDAVVSVIEAGGLALADPYALARLDVVLARVTDDPDGMTAHGIVQIEAGIETVV